MRLRIEVHDWDVRDVSWGWNGERLPDGFHSDDLVRLAIEVLEQHLHGDERDAEDDAEPSG